MTQDRLIYLLECYAQNACSDAELAELEEWYHAHNPGGKNMGSWLQEYSRERLSEEMYLQFRRMKEPAAKRVILIKLYRAAAAAAVVFAAAGTMYLARHSAHMVQPAETAMQAGIKNDSIKPGSNKAVLILADKTVITLGDTVSGVIAVQGHATIDQVQKGAIAYNQANDAPAPDKMQYNTLSTPRGGKYTVSLADGTLVTLDAASSITYPVAFTGKERRVEITGQAYFEVVHRDAQPFRVTANGQTIEDVGTAFNINAYNDESAVRVTLASGRADVFNASGRVSLIPGEQAQVNNGQQQIKVSTVNVEETIAWKNGWFIFHHESIQQVMKQAARWYDIEVAYEGVPMNKTFGGTISKYKDIAELLQNLRIVSGIQYRIEGRRITLFN
ncbi:FecR family protein [Deminuibacter soli]|uniref:FecR family protein n=1 Tax=Deminuibacter soli TaxID=2291815 RepID=A0A3E1NM73_9BACT|nr:FecR family protein [Deminuibacter soli]RFM29030.1 FecR family protein [Deminuibacter soli]